MNPPTGQGSPPMSFAQKSEQLRRQQQPQQQLLEKGQQFAGGSPPPPNAQQIHPGQFALSPSHPSNQQQQQQPPQMTMTPSQNMQIAQQTLQQQTTVTNPGHQQQQQMQQHHQEQLHQQQAGEAGQQQAVTNGDQQGSSSIKSKIKGFFHHEQQGPNIGFKPTASMIQRHENIVLISRRPRFQFQCTKLRSWRTGYVRLLCVYDDHFATFDPDSHQVTNTWNYDTLKDFVAAEKDQLLLDVSTDKLKFQCHNVDRSLVLSSILQCQDEHTPIESPIILCNRWTRHETQVPSALRLTPYALVEIHPTSKKRVQTYRYVNILAISLTSDEPSGLILHFKNKKTTRLFSITTKSRSDVVTFMRQGFDRIGLELRMTDSNSVAQWKETRRSQQQVRPHTIATEWSVTKQSKRHDAAIVGSTSGWPGGLVQRTLCITGDGLILEKDLAGMTIASRPLSELYSLVRPASVGDQICLEYDDGESRTYSSPSRDSLLVSLLDAAFTLGKNPRVQVSEVPSGGYCLASFAKSATSDKSGGLFQPISIPIHCLKRVHAVATAAFAYMNANSESSTEEGVPMNPFDECRNVMEICREFNASVLPNAEGLPTTDKDKFVLGSIGALWGVIAELLEVKKNRHLAEQTAGPMFQTLHRLSKTKAGYKNSIELATFVDCLPLLWTIEDDFCKFWAFRVLTVLLSGLANRDKEVEYVNKSVIFKAGGIRLIQGLVQSLLLNQANQENSDLIRMVMSDILQSLLCTYADTTSPEVFAALIRCLGENYEALLGTLYQQTPFVIENSALLLHLLSTHAPDVSAGIREESLSSAILLHHFHSAIFSPLEGQRFLSRFLCSLWLSGPADCAEKRLLKRIVPSGFMNYLKIPLLSRAEEEQLDEIERDFAVQNVIEEDNAPNAGSSNASGAAGTNMARLRSKIAISRAAQKDFNRPPPENFRIFFHVLTQNHSLPDLIWNQQTRRELRIGLESEIQYMRRETAAKGMGKIAWNHQQFVVTYASLDDELKVGNVYMRLWLQAGDGFIKSWEEPLRLFENLFRRLLCSIDRDAKVTIMCIRCLERLYSIHGQNIGEFPDVMILVRSMASTRSIETQHRLLGLLATILGVQGMDNPDELTVNIPENAEQLLNTESIEQLCQFVAWGHTNGVQVGNLMTNILGNIKPGYAMLTDGTPQAPDAYKNRGEQEQVLVDEDAVCPSVWFTASTGRIPPSYESIRGPFRVSQLQRMMDDGDLSPFTLVTSTHVESYEDEDLGDEGGVREAQIDTGRWKRLEQVWQLRWQLCTDGGGGGIFSPSEVSLRAVRSLTRLVDLHKSLDSRGVPYAPIPTAKRIMCGLNRDAAENSDATKSFLSILAQAVLCNDPKVVDCTAELLSKLTQYNEEATSKFYLTGIFFFIASYTGSNFKNLSKLLHSTHLSQHFRSGFAATADKDELPLKERSILGTMLPEGVLYILFNYGVERFAEVFVGNYDTPEVIWSLEMRRHLIEMVTQHLGDFPKRLWQNTTTEYEYCPMPGIAYKRLEKEIFCHNYYLHNLCDEARFPDWPISEPVEVFRACLEELKKQVNRDEEDEEQALERALKVLVLQPGDGSKELRRAYRSLARKFHPDKNPAGRDMFEAIQQAYELLLPRLESGQKVGDVSADGLNFEAVGDESDPQKAAEGFVGGLAQMQTMHLLFRTQALIYRRFGKEMKKYKYPAYQIILSCLELPKSSQDALTGDDAKAMLESSIMTPKRAQFILDAVGLVFQTCLVSPLNAEELVAESGVVILESLLHFFLTVAHLKESQTSRSGRVATDAIICEILSTILHTLGGVAFYESGREALVALDDLSRFCINWRRCLDGKYVGSRFNDVGDSQVKKFALEGVINMGRHEDLQTALIGAGVVWPLTRLLLGFDKTLDEGNVSNDSIEDDLGASQAACNSQARLATRAIGILCGVLQHSALSSPENPALQSAMSRILTNPIAMLLRNKRSTEILVTLNSNMNTPSRIWSVSMRSTLLNLLDTAEDSRPEDVLQSVAEELEGISTFEYAELKDELQVGGVYIRIFNQLGVEKGAMRHIQSPGVFIKRLTDFLRRSINCSKELPSGCQIGKEPGSDPGCGAEELQEQCVPVSDTRFVQIITAFRNLVRVDGMVDDVLADKSMNLGSVLLSLLELPQESEAFEVGFDILSTLGPKQEFADAVATQGALWRLLWVLERAGEQEATNDANGQASRPNDILRKQRGWVLLESLSSAPSVAMTIVDSMAWFELLGILVGYSKFTKIWIARIGAAKILSRLLWDPKTGPVLVPLLHRFLPPTLVLSLKEGGPDTMLKQFDAESDTPELIWDGSMRFELRKVIGENLDAFIEKRQQGVVEGENFSLNHEIRVSYENLNKELFVGGVYVSRFLKEPTFNLRDPTSFLEMLLKRWDHELGLYAKTPNSSTGPSSDLSGQDALQTLTSASVYLCRVKENLCEKLAQWGYMSRCLVFLESFLAKQVYDTPLLSVMRILHVAANRRPNIEALLVSGKNDSTHGIVTFTMQAIGKDSLHADSAFIVEMLKKVFLDALGKTNLEDLQGLSRTKMPQQNQYSGTDGVVPRIMDMAPSPAPSEERVSCMRGNARAYRAFAMAPSPAPGEGPVSRNRVTTADDPLAMAMGSPPPDNQQTPQNRSAPQLRAVQNQQSIYGGGGQGDMYLHQTAYQGQAYPQTLLNQSAGQTQTPGSYYGAQQSSSNQNQINQRMQTSMYQSGVSIGLQGGQQQQDLQVSNYHAQTNQTYQQWQGQGYPGGSYSSQNQASAQNQYMSQNQHIGGLMMPVQQQVQSPQIQQYQSYSQEQPVVQQGAPYQSRPMNPVQTQAQPRVQGNFVGQTQQDRIPRLSQGPVPNQATRTTAQVPPLGYSGNQQPMSSTPQVPQQGLGSSSGFNLQSGGARAPSSAEATPMSPHLQTPAFQSPAPPTTSGVVQNSQLGALPFTQQPSPQMDSFQRPSSTQNESNLSMQSGAQQRQVETVTDSKKTQGSRSSAEQTEGAGVDARAKENPTAEAERRANTVPGAPGSADGRVALLQSALVCELPRFLVENVLENLTISNVKDPAALKVHSVELLKLLTTDPGFGMLFSLKLQDISAWKKYKTQDHSLFITGPVQRADYFLTDGKEGGAAKLLTEK